MRIGGLWDSNQPLEVILHHPITRGIPDSKPKLGIACHWICHIHEGGYGIYIYIHTTSTNMGLSLEICNVVYTCDTCVMIHNDNDTLMNQHQKNQSGHRWKLPATGHTILFRKGEASHPSPTSGSEYADSNSC